MQKIIFSFLHFQGGILMPLFFLISGFSLARSYGPRMSLPKSKFEPEKDKLPLLLKGLFVSWTSWFKCDPLTDLWPLRLPPKEFPSIYFYKARIGEWENPNEIIRYCRQCFPGWWSVKTSHSKCFCCLSQYNILLCQLVFCRSTCWATFYAFLLSIGASS